MTPLFRTASVFGLCLIWTGCGNAPPEVLPEAKLEQLERGDDGLHLKTTNELFTGYLVEFYSGGETNQLKSKSVVRSGKLNGLSEGWFRDGQLQVREEFLDGKSHGVRVKWHPNGEKHAEDTIEHGELHGPCRKWHDNGQLAEEMIMVNGQPDGQARSWHPDGSQKAEVLMKMGEVLKQEFWKEGEKSGGPILTKQGNEVK